MKKLAHFIFLLSLVIPITLGYTHKQIPVSVDEDSFTDSSEFQSQYDKFSVVGSKLRTRVLSVLQSLIEGEFGDEAFCLVPPNKGTSSLKRKMDLEFKVKKFGDYTFKDFEDVKDFVRASMIFPTIEEIYEAGQGLEEYFGEVLKKDDTFDRVKSPLGKGKTGYRDLSYNFAIKQPTFGLKPNESLSNDQFYYMRFEVQIHLCGIFLAKQIGHLVYEIVRIVGQVKDQSSFEKILPESQRHDFFKTYEEIKDILPEESERSSALIQTFEEWNKNKADLDLQESLLQKLQELSRIIYNHSLESDQSYCMKILNNVILNESCSFKESVDLEKISAEFVRDVLKKSY